MLSETLAYAREMRPDGDFALAQRLSPRVRRHLDRVMVPKLLVDTIARGGEDEAAEMSFFLFRVCLLAACLQADDVQISRATSDAIYLISAWSDVEAHLAEAILMDNDCIKDKGVFDYE